MMIVDRIFGLIAAAAFAAGIIAQAELLLSTDPKNPLEPLFVVLFTLAVVAYGYATLRAARREGLVDPADESLDLVEVTFSLPRWVIAAAAVLAAYIVLLVVGAHNARPPAQWPDDLALLRQSLNANGMLALFSAVLTLTSFVIAAFFLIREPLKELR